MLLPSTQVFSLSIHLDQPHGPLRHMAKGLLSHMATLPLNRALPQSQPLAAGQIALAKTSHYPLPHMTTLLLAPWSHCPGTWWFCPFQRGFLPWFLHRTSWNQWWCQLYTSHKLPIFFSFEGDIKWHRPIRRVKRRNFPQSPLNSFDLSPMYRAGARRGLESAPSAQICANNSLCALCLSAL